MPRARARRLRLRRRHARVCCDAAARAQDDVAARGVGTKQPTFVEQLKYKARGPALRRCGCGAAAQRLRCGSDGCALTCAARARRARRQSLSVGTKLWGVVAEVGPRRLVISLPSGLRGTVRAAEVRGWQPHAAAAPRAARAA